MNTPRAIDSVLKAVGRTPLVRLSAFERASGPRLYAKCEYMSPGGSIFDRAAVAQITEAILGGHLSEGGTLVSAGGTDVVVSLAMAASATGHRFIAVVPRSMMFERKRVLADYGAKLVQVDDAVGLAGAHEKAIEVARESKALCVCLGAGRTVTTAYEAIGRELIEALESPPTLTFCGLDYGAIPNGLSRGLAGAALVAVEPAESDHLMLGLNPRAEARALDHAAVTEIDSITDADAWELAERLAKETGLLAGLGSGAVLVAMLRRSLSFGADDTLVAVLPDMGERRFMLSSFFA